METLIWIIMAIFIVVQTAQIAYHTGYLDGRIRERQLHNTSTHSATTNQ